MRVICDDAGRLHKAFGFFTSVGLIIYFIDEVRLRETRFDFRYGPGQRRQPP
jgi:hypothetical protein